MKVYKIGSGNPGVGRSCLGGCGLMIGWVLVGIGNVAFMSRFEVPPWMPWMLGCIWLLSAPVGAVVYLKWRARRHTQAFKILEGKMTEKTQQRLRKQSPDA